jgi:predicted CxxxxCH...CXXCH cytochrome family protein
MKRPVALLLASLLITLTQAFTAGAMDAPHYDLAVGRTCGTCHTVQQTLGSTGYNNVCLNCHRPGDPSANSNPITLGDTANPYGSYSTADISIMYQTSHRWDGPDTNPAAAAQPPLQGQMTSNSLRERTGGEMACVRCHNQHFNTYGRFLRVANDRDQLCLDCHRSRNVQSHTKGSHPVGVTYDGAKAGLKPIPANTANPTADLNNYLKAGTVSCSTCHGVHFSDSRGSTPDGRANFANISSGDGFILRTDRKGAAVAAGQPDAANICTNCHAGKGNHNLKGQNVQCDDCHGAHVDYDPADPAGTNGTNIHLIRRTVAKGTSGSGQVFYRYTGSRREFKNSQNTGVCQGCHAVPAPGGLYPAEHAGNDAAVCTTCHFHGSANGSFSGACTACHGYPPLTATLGGPSGLALPATSATSTSPGAHETHAKTRFMACLTCHTGYTAKPMPSNSIDIGFAINGTNFPGFGGSSAVGTFNATTVNSGYVWSAAPGTTLTTGNPSITCSVYCHGTTLSGGSVAAPTWTITDGSQKACGACHGVTAAAAPATGGHQRHAGNGAGALALPCASCHGAHDNNDHVNGSVNWDLSALPGGGQYKGSVAGATGQLAPSATFGSCANLYCHSNGTTLQTVTAAPRIVPVWGGAPIGCDGCHDGVATGPSYPNGAPKANSHAVHVVTNGFGCNTCHYDTTTSGTAITTQANHVNWVFNLAPNTAAGVSYTATVGTPTTPSSCAAISCHGGNSATWGGKAACQDCHLTTGPDVDDFGATFWNNGIVAKVNSAAWTTTGHGRTTAFASGNPAASFSGANVCEYCHDYAIPHKTASNPFRLKNFSDAAWQKNGVCMSCHASGSSGVTVDGVLRNGTKKVTSYHYGNRHTAASSGGQFCWDCHDGHGDANWYMIHDSLAAASDVVTGAPLGTPLAVSFTAAVTGTDYARSTAPFNGVCNVCHTATLHYTATSGDGHNSLTRCTSCHAHNGTSATTAFTPAGGSGACNGCHGYPPARPGFAGTFNNWSAARTENYPGGGGAHTVNNHVSSSARPADGFTQCAACHNPADHAMSPVVFQPSLNIKINVNQAVRFVPGQQARYTSNRLDGAQHLDGTCSNINCHFGATPVWDQR